MRFRHLFQKAVCRRGRPGVNGSRCRWLRGRRPCRLACCLPNSPCSPPRRLWCLSRARGRCGTAAAPAARAPTMQSTRWPTATTRAAAVAPAAGAATRRCERRRLCRKRHRLQQQRLPPRRDVRHVRRSLLARAMLWGALLTACCPTMRYPAPPARLLRSRVAQHWHRCRPLHPFSLLPLPTCCCHLSAMPVACSAANLTPQTCLFPASVAPRKGAVYSGSYRAAVYVWKLPSIPSADSPVPPFLCVVSAPDTPRSQPPSKREHPTLA